MSMVGRINMLFTLQVATIENEQTVWVDAGSFWGRMQAANDLAGSSHKIIMRCNPELAVSVGQRVMHESHAYLVCAVSDPNLNKKWQMLHVKKEEYLN